MRGTSWDHAGGGCLIGAVDSPYPGDGSYASRDRMMLAKYSRTMAPNPMGTWGKVAVGILVVGLVGAGVFLYTTTAQAAPALPPSEAAAVSAAVEQLGPDAATAEIAQLAFVTAYPGQPMADPAWASIVTQVETALGRPLVPIKIPSGVADSSDEAAELVADWLSSLREEQRASARQTIGAPLWDALVSSSMSGDDIATRGALLAIKLAVEAKVHDSKLGALATYASLQSSLGDDKLEEFMEILDDTVGRPKVNPAARPPWPSTA